MRKIFRLTLLLGLIGGAFAFAKKMMRRGPEPIQEIHGDASTGGATAPGHTYTTGGTEPPAESAPSVQVEPPSET